MDLAEICRALSLEVRTGADHLDREVTGGYASDLLSCVMARAQAGNIWVTLQFHPNIVAVASLLNLAAIILTEGVVPEQATVSKAEDEGVVLLLTPLPTFAVVGKLAALGIAGVE